MFEPPGETHTLMVPEDCPEMITLFHITGVMVYVDPWGKQTGYEDVFTKIDMCRRALRSGRPRLRLRRAIREVTPAGAVPERAQNCFNSRSM